MFSGKLFAIISAVIVVAVNGSPVDLAGGQPQGNQPQGDQNPGGKSQTSATGPTIDYCKDTTKCPPLIIDPNVCTPVPDDFKKQISEFNFKGFTGCKVYSDADCTQDPHPLPLTDTVPDSFFVNPHFKCSS